MSIKTYQDDNGARLLLAIALSLILHAGAAIALLTIKPSAVALIDRLVNAPEDKITVDVIELPPDAKSVEGRKNRNAKYESDRTVIVPEDIVPEDALETGRIIIPGAPNKPPDTPILPDKKPVTQGNPAMQAAKDPIGADKGIPGEETYFEPGKTGKSDSKSKTKPSLFPSEQRLAELERKYLAEAPKGEKGKTLSLNTSESKYQRYLIGMKHRIEFNWAYPEAAARRGWQGSLMLDFTIKKDGTIADIRLEKSSNYPVLDEAAVTALRLAAPFPPFPADFDVEELTIKGQFIYDLIENPRDVR